MPVISNLEWLKLRPASLKAKNQNLALQVTSEDVDELFAIFDVEGANRDHSDKVSSLTCPHGIKLIAQQVILAEFEGDLKRNAYYLL